MDTYLLLMLCVSLRKMIQNEIKSLLAFWITICKDKRKAIALKAPRKQYTTRAKSQCSRIMCVMQVARPHIYSQT